VLITAVLIISWRLTPDAEDFGGDQSSSAAPIIMPSDIRVTGGIGPATDLPAASGDPVTAPDDPVTATGAGEPAAGQPDSPGSGGAGPAAGNAVDEPPALAAGIPTALELPSLGVHAEVLPVGITAGQLDVPTDPADVGWWTGSVVAGSPAGATVIDGHVDSAELGAGALYRLTDLAIADTIRVTVAGGGTVTYRVDERRTYDKTNSLPAAIFGTDGAPRLVLITCGGAFDTATLSYESNVAVFASPA
jgi:hypothetical protein